MSIQTKVGSQYKCSQSVFDKGLKYWVEGYVREVTDGSFRIKEYIIKLVKIPDEFNNTTFFIGYTCTCPFDLEVKDPFHFCSHMAAVHLKRQHQKKIMGQTVEFKVYNKINKYKKSDKGKKKELLCSFCLALPTPVK